ncbi:MAG: hypothetical protein V7647_955 [Acidobacteriota bacterium]
MGKGWRPSPVLRALIADPAVAYFSGPPDAFSKATRFRRSSTSFARMAGSSCGAAFPDVPTALAVDPAVELPLVPAAPASDDPAVPALAFGAAGAFGLAAAAVPALPAAVGAPPAASASVLSGPRSEFRLAATFA